MEKDKGIFPFRKHPVGELLDGKKGRKLKMRRTLGVLLAAALIFNTLPAGGLVVSASEQGTRLCEHHTEHTAECGYAEAQSCTHEHGEECYKTVTECVHTHTDECYPETEETGESGCITKILDCHHEHNESCGYKEAQECGYVCEICNGTETEDADTNFCAHHREHTPECGYSEEDNTPCGYVCRVCPIEDLIAALPEQVTEDNAEEVRVRLDEILVLYGELNEDEQEQINLSRCYELQTALDAANTPMTADGHTEQQDTDEASVTIGADTLYYATLKEAFESANGQTATITMLKDAEYRKESKPAGSPLNITSGTVTLDLNGKTLSGMGYGYYGIVNVDGGSLSVQGEGTIKVERFGLSCYRGSLTVDGIFLQLNNPGFSTANAGVTNQGGTIILNKIQITGESSYGQIYQFSGNTTINDVTATGTTDSYGSVWYYDDGTLKINGGTFEKIVVDSENSGGIHSVAELLGEGCTYRHRDGGAWATADELKALEISNVTVGKIPLTIKPQGENSWFYNPNQTHTLALNAAPVDSSDSVTYEWKNGDEVLGTEATYIVPAGLSVGNYTYTCEATCDGYTLSHDFTFEIKQSGTTLDGKLTVLKDGTATDQFSVSDTITVKAEPTATGEAPANGMRKAGRAVTQVASGQMALFIGDTQVSEPVNADGNGSYTMTVSASEVRAQDASDASTATITLTAKFVGNENMANAAGTVNVTISAAAKAVNGGTTTYYDAGNLASAFDAANTGATVTLLADVALTNYDCIQIENATFTLDLNGHNISKTDNCAINLITNANLTICGNGNVTGYLKTVIVDGTLTLEGGIYSFTAPKGTGVQVTSYGTLNVTGADVNISRLFAQNRSTVSLTAGTYNSIGVGSSETLAGLLGTDKHYAYYRADGTLILLAELEGKKELTETVTVKECNHEGEGVCTYAHVENTFTHTKTCLACGQTWVAEGCNYTFSGTTGTCSACGDSVTVAVSGTENLVYTGTPHTPTVTVKRGETALTADNYKVTYNNNTNAGTDTAKVTVTIGNNQGAYTGTFSIGQATPAIAWSSTLQELTYTGNPVVITAPTVTLADNESFNGTISYSYKKEGETAYKDGLPTDAGTYKVKAHIDAGGNYAAADSTNELELTIKKADAEITVGTAAYHVAYGEPAFAISGVTDTNPEADVQYAVTKGTDVISVENGTVSIRGAGEAEITVSLSESANYNAAESRSISVTVDKKSGYTVDALNRSYFYHDGGTDSIDLAALLPKDCGNVTYGEPGISGNVAYSAAPAVSGGKLSYTINSGNVNDEGTVTVIVSTQNYADVTVTVNVKLTEQIPVSLKAGTEVTLKNHILTYGEPLSDLVFNGAEFVGTDGKTVAGTLVWKEAAATPDAGTGSAVWVFTPEENKYIALEGTTAITVNKAVPAVSASPAVADRIYHPSVTLKAGDLSGGTVTGVNGRTLEGTWNWQSAAIVPTVNNSGYVAAFTPQDTTNYETVTRTITVNVAGAVPYIAEPPAAAGITYGETLNDSVLSGGTVLYGDGTGQAGTGAGNTAAVAGTFAWKDPSTKPAVADSNATEYTVVFTPSDTANYSPVEAKITLTVNKAQNAPNMPGSTMDVSNSLKKVGDVPLPEGWEWQPSDRDTALEAGKAVNAVAVYTGADQGNYEKETVTVAITRSACDHVAGEILYTGAGEKAPTCRSDGLGHRECIKCGDLVESGIVVKALGHTGGTATCSKRAVCTRCNQPYGDLDSSVHGDTEVRRVVAATCTAVGYTGDTYCKDCGAKIKTGSATPALGHDYTSTVTQKPTTGSEGTRTYTCTRCGHSYKESIPKLPEETHHHTYTESVTKQPTCTDTGVRTYTCSCGDSYTETIAALGHYYQSSVTKQPTTMAEGVMTYTCTRCGHSYTRSIEKLPGDDTTEQGIPFIKDGDGKSGWDVIRAEEEKAEEGSIINVDMNGSTVVPGDIFDSIRGKDVIITFDMGNGILWSVDGKSIAKDNKTDDIDFSVKTGANAIPVDIANNITGKRYSIQISLAYEGEFGFTAVLSVGLGRENAGYTASLYYYNESTGKLEFICSDEVAEDGTVALAFTHASDYVIAIDEQQEESTSITEPVQPEDQDEDSTGQEEESPQAGQAGQAWRPWWLIVVGAMVIAVVIGVFFVVKKGKDGDSGQ